MPVLSKGSLKIDLTAKGQGEFVPFTKEYLLTTGSWPLSRGEIELRVVFLSHPPFQVDHNRLALYPVTQFPCYMYSMLAPLVSRNALAMARFCCYAEHAVG